MEFLRFLYRMLVPAYDEEWFKARLCGKPEVKFQPYLSTAIFYGAVFTLLIGDPWINPPGPDGVGIIDSIWIVSAIIFPLIALISDWAIVKRCGRRRYFAMWTRLIANVGLMTALMSYQAERLLSGQGHPFEDTILFVSIVYLLVLIVGDIRFLTLTERLADELVQRQYEHE